jgi:hypothetical protein
MGFFSFIGKAVKGIAKVVGGVAKVAAPLALGGPLGGVAGGILGNLLHSKSPMSATPLKIRVAGGQSIPILRAKTPNPVIHSSAAVLRQSPTMPGGSFASPAGIMAPGGGLPPATYGGRKATGGGKKRKRRSSSSARSSRARSGKKRKSGGRKLKFGSPAWRKKYMKRRGR